MKLFSITALLFALIACTTYPHDEGREEYLKKLNHYTSGDKKFSGLYDNFEFRGTLLTPTISRIVHDRMAQIYGWDNLQKQEHLQKEEEELRKHTRVWMSFFTPSNKDDNLDKKTSIWKTYLEVNGTRYEGTAVRSKQSLTEAQALFPYHSRWATIYHLQFPLSSDQLEGQSARLIITGPLGRREVLFPGQSSL